MAAAAATAQQETRAARIQLQYTLMQSEHSNHNHRYLPSPAHTDLINNKVNDAKCAKIRRKSADGYDNTNNTLRSLKMKLFRYIPTIKKS